MESKSTLLSDAEKVTIQSTTRPETYELLGLIETADVIPASHALDVPVTATADEVVDRPPPMNRTVPPKGVARPMHKLH